ncbi:MFS transporter [Nocardioides sp. DS6]|uniref:MFS transporter n=1 Tax=Nocardioides eburneus TaxID=3231482 RepID=A0ABV3T197_9ACTN
MTTRSAVRPLSAQTGVTLTFTVSGVLFASFVSRLADVRASLHLTNGHLGLLLLSSSVGSVAALPAAGRVVERWGAAGAVRAGAVLGTVALVLAGFGATVVDQPWLAAVGLFGYGIGFSLWDVAMNVEAAEVERRVGRTIMPRFHAMWSVGGIAGSVVGIPMAAASVPVIVHLLVVAAVVLAFALRGTTTFLPYAGPDAPTSAASARSAWTEPRTLAIGLLVLTFGAVEGSANDWLTLAVIDGYDAPHWVGVAGYSVFVVCMTLGRWVGSRALDRYGRVRMLWVCAVAAVVGILVTVYAGHLAPALAGIAIWGLGAALGFPVGMSAAADDPVRAPARVAVVSTVGYTAFLCGPPLLGWLGDHVGTLDSLLVIAVLMVPASVAALAARPLAMRPTSTAAGTHAGGQAEGRPEGRPEGRTGRRADGRADGYGGGGLGDRPDISDVSRRRDA